MFLLFKLNGSLSHKGIIKEEWIKLNLYLLLNNKEQWDLFPLLSHSVAITVQLITGTVPLEQLGVKCLVQGHNCEESWVSSNGNQTKNLPGYGLSLILLQTLGYRNLTITLHLSRGFWLIAEMPTQ